MSLLNGLKGKVFKSVKLKKRHFDPEKMSIEDITLPFVINNMDIANVENLVREEFKIYKSLGYKDLPLDQLKYPEYHSFQIGVMLRYLKEDKVCFIPNVDDILNSAATVVTKRNLHIKVFDIVFRYNEIVEKMMSKEELEGDRKWTPMEVSYLLKYISLENRSISVKK